MFSKRGIDISWQDYKGGTGDMIKALESKQLNLAVLLTEGALKASLQSKNFKIIQIYVNTPLVWGVYCGVASKFKALSEVEKPDFCISRPGSGSHLMAYLLSKKLHWNSEQLLFTEVGNFQGALDEFSKCPDKLFLWERFMTKPYVTNNDLRKLSEIPTPWPSFCIVANNDLVENNRSDLIEIMTIISTYTYKFKQNTLESIDYISDYFNFSAHDMRDWIIDTDWNYFLDRPELKLDRVILFLKEMNLVDAQADVFDAVPDDAFWDGVELFPPVI